MQDKISRHKFFKILSYTLLIPFVFLLNKMVKDLRQFQSSNRELRITDPASGLSINGPIIISKDENEMTIFSSRCTHLGCEINKIEDGEIVCPCHGSRYDKTGKPTKGPSIKSLKKLDYTIDQATNEIVIKLG